MIQLKSIKHKDQLIEKWQTKYALGEVTEEEAKLAIDAINFNFLTCEINKSIFRNIRKDKYANI